MHRCLVLIVAVLSLVVPASAVAADPPTKEEEATKVFATGKSASGDQCVAVLFAQFKNIPRYRSTSYKTTLQGDDGVGYPATGSATEAFYADSYDFHGLTFPAPAGMHQVVVSQSYRLGGDGNCSDLDARTQQLYPHPVTIVYTKVPTAVVNVTGDQSNPAASQSDETCDVNRALTGLQCTLRAAIELSNKLKGIDINFNIPATGVPRITPATALPQITTPTVIDARTQPGGWVEVAGPGGGNQGDLVGIDVAAGGGASELRGLVVHGFQAHDVRVKADGTTIAGNRIGTDVTGTLAQSNVSTELWVEGDHNRLADNVIAGETDAASGLAGGGQVVIVGDDNLVVGNRIGVGADGRVVSLPPQKDQSYVGIFIVGDRNVVGGGATSVPEGSCLSPCNLIVANWAVQIGDRGYNPEPANDTEVSGNWIGVDANGTPAFSTAVKPRTGVLDESPARRSLVRANLMYVSDVAAWDQGGGRILNNRIYGAAGEPLNQAPNLAKVMVDKGSEVSGNVISSYSDRGLVLDGGDTKVERNTITDNPLGGILILSGAGHKVSDNVLRDNGLVGILAVHFDHSEAKYATPPGAVLARNTITGSPIGIDLSPFNSDPIIDVPPGGRAFRMDGVTLNDANDSDEGPNGFLNFPGILSASLDGASMSVSGFVDGPLTSGGEYKIEAFTSPSCAPAATVGGFRYGAGAHYVGSGQATSSLGSGDFTLNLSGVPAGDRVVSLTATREDQGVTSEFSRCVLLTGSKAVSEYRVKSGQTGTVADGDRAKVEIPAVARSSSAGRGHGAGRLYVTRYDDTPGSGASAKRYWLLADRGLTGDGGAAKGKGATFRICLDTAGAVARAALGKTVIARRSESTGGVWKPLRTELSSASLLCAPGVTALGEFAFLTGPKYKPRKAKLTRLTVNRRVVKKTARVRISCAKTALCEGTLRVSVKQGRKTKQIGKTTFAVPAGKIAAVKVKLSRSPRKGRPLAITATATTATSTLTKTTKLKR